MNIIYRKGVGLKKVKIRLMANICAALCGIAFVGVGCAENQAKDIQVYAPDGAPALSIAKLLQEDSADDGVSYTVVNATAISAYVTGETPKADVCILPLNLAGKLLGDGREYALCAVVTHGNLYMLSTQETVYNAENLSALIGKTVGVVQLANVPGLTFKIILNKFSLPWRELTNDQTPQTEVVNLKAISPDMVSPTIKDIDVFVTPEPAASVKVNKTALNFVGDLQALYSVQNGYPQAVLVIKKNLIQDNHVWVESFLQRVKENATWLPTQITSLQIQAVCQAVQAHLTEGLSPSLTAQNLSASSIQNASVRFEEAFAYQSQITLFLNEMQQVQPNAATQVQEDFYYVN